MHTYGVTINPYPHKRWDKILVNSIYNELYEGKLYSKNYGSLPGEIQEEVLKAILNYLVKRSPPGCEWGDYILEDTKLNNRHLHVYFKDNKVNQDLMTNDIVVWLNEIFSNSLPGQYAVFIEETTHDVEYWKKYMQKNQWQETLMNLKIDTL